MLEWSNTVELDAFITLRTVDRAENKGLDCWHKSKYVHIRLSTITEIWEPRLVRLYEDYDSFDEEFNARSYETFRKLPHNDKIVRICKSTLDGQGLNGVSCFMYIDEPSWKKLVEVLGLNEPENA